MNMVKVNLEEFNIFSWMKESKSYQFIINGIIIKLIKWYTIVNLCGFAFDQSNIFLYFSYISRLLCDEHHYVLVYSIFFFFLIMNQMRWK